MSSDSDENVKNIEKLLSNIPDNVMDIFSSFMKNNDNKNLEQKSKEEMRNLEMIMTMKNLMDRFNNHKDSRLDLINALKPFLKPSRQEKVLKCINALRLSNFCKEAKTLTTGEKEKEVGDE